MRSILQKGDGARRKSVQIVSVMLFWLGFGVGLWLALGTVWANLEASLFDSAIRQDERLRSLRCPALITAEETAFVRAELENGSEKPVNFLVRANISNGFVTLKRELRATVPLEPGEAEEISWPVTAADAAYGRFILSRVTVLRSPPYPARDAACGIWLVHTSLLTGGQLTALALLVSLGGLLGGLALRVWNERPFQDRRRGSFLVTVWLAVLVVVMMAAGLLRLWTVGVVLIAFSLLMVGVLLERYVSQP